MARIEAEERQFSLLLALVSTKIGATKRELFERVAGYQDRPESDALERMFERDKDALRELGIVIDQATPSGDDSNHELRYRVLDTSLGTPQEVRFDEDERELIDLALRVWHEGGLTDEAQRAALKLRADPDFRAGLPLDRTPGRTEAPDAPMATRLAARQRPREAAFAALKRAADHGREVVFDYLKPGERCPRTRFVQPWATVLFRGRWMLVGHDLGAEDSRTFLMARIVSPVRDRAAKSPFSVPQDAAAGALTKLEAIWESAEVGLRVVPGSDADVRLRHRPGTRLDGDVLVIHHADRHLLADELTGFGPDVEVAWPEEMRELTRARLARIRDAHAPAGEGA